MSTRSAGAHFQRVLTLVTAQDLQQRSDAELVERYVQRHDEAAFEVLLKRHGPLVLRVCRRLLSCDQDAEDVFQATFVVFARKAAALKKSASVGSWLYGVASRLCAKSRASSQRRRERNPPIAVTTPSEDALSTLTVREAEQILHEELAKMPTKYRQPLIMCYLEGRTRDEAAVALGCALGTLKDRLLRAKTLLHNRLVRRGVSLSVALVTNLLSDLNAHAALSETLTRTVVQAATGAAAPPLQVGALADWGQHLFSGMQTKLAAGFTATTLLVGTVVGLASFGPATAKPVPIGDAKAIVVADELEKKVQQQEMRFDALGDPLPKGAFMRLGTRRHRVQTWPLSWQSLPDGKSYLALQRPGVGEEIRRIDSKTGLVIETWPVPERFSAFGFSPDGRYVLMGTPYVFHTGFRIGEQKEKWALTLYDLGQRREVWTKEEMIEEKDWKHIDICCFSTDGKWFVTNGRFGRGSMCVWDATTGAQLWERPNELFQSFDVLGFADGNKLVGFRDTKDGQVHLYDRNTGAKRRSFPTAPRDECPDGGLLSPDGGFVILSGYGPKVRIWDLMGKERPALEGHKERARQIAFSPDGKTLFTGSEDPFVLERRWPSGEVIRKIDLGRSGIDQMAASGDGKRLEVMFWGEQAIAFYDLETGKALPAIGDSHRGKVNGIATAPDGSLVSCGRDATIRTWDVKSGKGTAQFSIEQDPGAGGFALSADGRLVAVPSTDVCDVCIHERATGKLLRTIAAEKWSLRKLLFSPNGRWLAAIDTKHGGVQVWEAATGKQMLKLVAEQQMICPAACAFSPNGQTLAIAKRDAIQFFDTGTWKEQPGLEGVYASDGIAFSPDGRTLAAACVDGVRIFELATRRERLHRREGYPRPDNLSFSPDGRLLAWSDSTTKIHVLDVHGGAMLGPFAGHDDAVMGLTFTRDNVALASASADSTILLWDVATAMVNKSPQADDIDGAWKALAGDDAKAAFEAIHTLSASPEKTVKHIRQHLRPAEPLNADWLAARLRDLDSPTFAQRDRATRDLEKLGERAVPVLEKFLAGKLSAEAQDRAERILAKSRVWTSASEAGLRMMRALEALEWIGDTAAQRLVEELSNGADDAALTREAKAVLRRWGK